MKRGRSGQVTVFIIIGIILLIIVGVILAFQFRVTDDIPTTFDLSQNPVERYVQSCIIDVTEEAAFLAGQHGGYIFVDEVTEDEREIQELLPFNSDTLLLNQQQIPYWYYQLDDGLDRVAIPELYKQYTGDDSIQDQLDRYISQNLDECLDDFEGLAEQGLYVYYAGEYIVSTRLGDRSIETTVTMPVDIVEGDSTSTMGGFTAIAEVGLKRNYDLAREIAEHELNTLFLEQATRNLLATYGQIDKDYLPPMGGGLQFETCANRVHWFYQDVEQDVRTMLAANIPFIQIANTEFTPVVVGERESDDHIREIRQAVFDALVQYPSTQDYRGITTMLNYQTTYPIELVFGNNLGYGLIQPNDMEFNILVANLCMFEYAFLYNLKYPVMVTLVDAETDVDGNAFTFQFPLQVVIKNNNPRIRLNDVFADVYNIPEFSPEPSYQCDPQQRLSGESTVTVQNAAGEKVDGVAISFQCGPSFVYNYNINGTVESVEPFARTCFMGATDNAGALQTTFPPCIGGGMITVQHGDYTEKSVATGDIRQGESFALDINLDKVYTKEVDVRKFFVGPASETNVEGIGIIVDEEGEITSCNLGFESKPLQQYESAIVTLTKKDTENGVLTGAPMLVFDPTDTEPQTIDIAAGTYAVDIMLMRDERYPGEMSFEANSQFMEVPSTVGSDKIYYPEEDVLIPQTFTGGALFEWTIYESELARGDTIEFRVFDEGQPRKLEEVSAPLMHRQTCSELQPDAIRPVVR